DYQKPQNKSFSEIEQVGEIVKKIEDQQQINIHNPSRDITFNSNNSVNSPNSM
ncbi:2009_t:CDS:2, partial [Racocetra fulgida]